MDEFEKIRAFSEQMSRQTEQAVANEEAEVSENYSKNEETLPSNQDEDNPNFLEEWHTEQGPAEPAKKTLSKTFWIVFSLTTIVLIALVVVFWLLLRTPMEKGEVVTISPTPNPVKVKPENPGGVMIPDQDKEIYTRLTQDTVPVRVEKLVETQEEKPIFPPVVAEEESVDVENQPEEVKVVTAVASAPEPVVVIESAPVKEEVKQQKVESKVKKETPKVQPSEKWRVQLFSSSDKAKVESTWKKISVKYKKLLSNMPMDIEKAEISGKGTFYRLKVGEFPTKERASTLCSKLKKQKQDCFPVK